MNINKTIGLFIVLFFFIASIVIRIPFLDKPLGDQHEWVTAHTLIALDNLDNRPLKEHWFRNIQTYPGAANKYINWVTTRIMDKNGISYYTSYPPFAIILPYILFKLFAVKFTVLNLEILNLLFHFISTIFIFLLLYKLIKTQQRTIPAVIGAAIHIFLYPNLWFFSTTYSWDILWHHFFIIELYIFYSIIDQNKAQTKQINRLIFLLGIINFLTIYTEYQGLFFAVGVMIYCFIFRLKPIYQRLFIIMLITSVLLLILVIIQYGTIAGFSTFLNSMFNKLFIEYGTLGTCEHGCSVALMLQNYEKLFSYLFIPVTGIMVIFLIVRSRQKNVLFSKNVLWTLGLTILPLFLHHLFLFPDAAAHHFALVKFSIIMSLVLPIIIASIIDSLHGKAKIIIAVALCLIVSQFLVVSTQRYIKDYPEKTGKEKYQQLGAKISAILGDEDVGFIVTKEIINPQLIYYTKRNLQQVNSEKEASDWCVDHHVTLGQLFVVDRGYVLTSVSAIEVNNLGS